MLVFMGITIFKQKYKENMGAGVLPTTSITKTLMDIKGHKK